MWRYETKCRVDRKLFIGAGINPAEFQRAAIFMSLFYQVVSLWAHFVPGPEIKGMTAAGFAERGGSAAGRCQPFGEAWETVAIPLPEIVGLARSMPEPDGGKDCQKGKEFLEGCFWIFRNGRAITNQVNSIACRENIRGIFRKLSIAANRLCRLFGILSGGEADLKNCSREPSQRRSHNKSQGEGDPQQRKNHTGR